MVQAGDPRIDRYNQRIVEASTDLLKAREEAKGAELGKNKARKKGIVGKLTKGQSKGINTWGQEREESRTHPRGHPAAKTQRGVAMRREEEKKKGKSNGVRRAE